jgi:hypothetical protein
MAPQQPKAATVLAEVCNNSRQSRAFGVMRQLCLAEGVWFPGTLCAFLISMQKC